MIWRQRALPWKRFGKNKYLFCALWFSFSDRYMGSPTLRVVSRMISLLRVRHCNRTVLWLMLVSLTRNSWRPRVFACKERYQGIQEYQWRAGRPAASWVWSWCLRTRRQRRGYSTQRRDVWGCFNLERYAGTLFCYSVPLSVYVFFFTPFPCLCMSQTLCPFLCIL